MFLGKKQHCNFKNKANKKRKQIQSESKQDEGEEEEGKEENFIKEKNKRE